MLDRAGKQTHICPGGLPSVPLPAAPLPSTPGPETMFSDCPLNIDMLEQNLGHEASLDILRTFLSCTAELVVELQSAIRVQSYKEAAGALREIHNSCTVVGAAGVLEQAIRMEAQLRNADWRSLERQMAELVRETREVGEFINQLLSQALRVHFSR